LTAIILGLLCGAALLSRVVAVWPEVFPESGVVRLLGVDPYFHLRHIRFVAEHFPDLQRWDVGTHYPAGQRSYVASLFDVGIGSVAYVVGLGDPSEKLVDQIAAWTPAILGSLSVACLFLLARTFLGRAASLLASAIYLLYPGTSLHRTLLGFTDHHVSEITFGLLTAWGLTRCLQTADSAKRGWPPLLPTLAYALPAFLVMYTWAGGAIYLLIVLVILFVMATLGIAHDPESMSTGRAALPYGGMLLLLIGLTGLLWPDLVISADRFPLALLGCVIIAVAPWLYTYTARALVRRYGNPHGVAIIAFIIVGGTAALLIWLHPLASHMLSSLVHQRNTILAEHRVVGWSLYWKLLGPGGILALLALPLGVVRALRSTAEQYVLVGILMGVAWIGLWMSSNDYDYAPPAFVGLLAAFVIHEAVIWIPALKTGKFRWAGVGVVAAVIIGPIWPLQTVVLPWATEAVAKEHVVIHPGWEQAMEWLRNETPIPSVPTDEPVDAWTENDAGFHYPADSYGVFSAWDFGNMVAALGKRAPIWSQWSNPKLAQWMLGEDEEQSLQTLCPTCEEGEQIRYIVLEARTIANHFPGKVLGAGRRLEEFDTKREEWYRITEDTKILHRTFGPRYHAAMAVRLFLDDAGSLGHYRLVYESPQKSYIPYLMEYGTSKFKRVAFPIPSEDQVEAFANRSGLGHVAKAEGHYEYDGVIASTVKIFERVTGALLYGTVAANSVVEARLSLKCGPEARVIDYRRSIQTEADGHYEIAVANATTPGTGKWVCESAGPYELHVKTPSQASPVMIGTFGVNESQLHNGDRIYLGKLN